LVQISLSLLELVCALHELLKIDLSFQPIYPDVLHLGFDYEHALVVFEVKVIVHNVCGNRL